MVCYYCFLKSVMGPFSTKLEILLLVLANVCWFCCPRLKTSSLPSMAPPAIAFHLNHHNDVDVGRCPIHQYVLLCEEFGIRFGKARLEHNGWVWDVYWLKV